MIFGMCKLRRACEAYARGKNRRFCGNELPKIYLIDRNVPNLENPKKYKITPPPLNIQHTFFIVHIHFNVQ